MDIDVPFLTGGFDLARFLEFFHLDCSSFLLSLRHQKAVATGADLVLFMAGAFGESLTERPRALILDVLCYGTETKSALVHMLGQAAYRQSEFKCFHTLGEWSVLPADKVTCMVRGQLSQRVVHLLELPRPPEEVVLSRTYGSMAGNYVTGSGHMISLFPCLTFARHRCWLPSRVTKRFVALLERKYLGWSKGGPDEDDVDEISALVRKPGDPYCWTVAFKDNGEVIKSSCPDWSRLVSADTGKALLPCKF